MNAKLIVLNGASSSGKSSIATCLQQQLEGTWLTLGIDDLTRALSHGPSDTTAGGSLHLSSDGSISVTHAFREAEIAWYKGVAAMVRAGAAVIADEVFLNGGKSQERFSAVLDGLPAIWVGVHCDLDAAEFREIHRGDRIRGQARHQADLVHDGVRYDLVLDTTHIPPDQCATTIIEWMISRDSSLSSP